MNWHQIAVWAAFFVGVALYILKRAYYLVKGPNPVANTYAEFFQKCWIPLLIRTAEDTVVFGIFFIPEALAAALQWLGWTNWASALRMITQYVIFAGAFGMAVDSVVDFLVTKIPGLKDWQPQMPGPLPKVDPAPVPPPQP